MATIVPMMRTCEIANCVTTSPLLKREFDISGCQFTKIIVRLSIDVFQTVKI